MKKLSETKIYQILFDESYDIKHKLQNSVLAFGSLIGGISSCFVTFGLGYNTVNNIVTVFTTIFGFAMLYLSAVLKKKKAASYLVSIVMNLIIFPILFINTGGIKSGMPIWLTFGIVFPWLIVEGKGCYILFALNLLSSLALIMLQWFHPELIVPLSDTDFVIDVAQSVVSIALIIGLTLRYQGYVYEKQNKMLKIQGEKLSRAIEAADKANIAKSSFLVSMSHEIRTPINAVLGMDEMILRESNDETIIGYAVNIQNAGQALLSTINDVLDFSKIESGKMDILPVDYDLAQLLNDCYNMMSVPAEKKNLKLIVENDENIPRRLHGDEVRIRQVLINFLTNAVKYTPKGQITLRCDYEKADDKNIMLKLSVEDTGTGISEENQKYLFNSYRRIDEVHNRNIEGTGLGLNITKQLVEMMNGTINVESELGKGSTFSFSLLQQIVSDEPIGSFESNRGKLIKPNKKYRQKFKAPNARILVVDDVKLNIDVMKGLLKNTQIQCDTAYSGRECLGLVRKQMYNLIFMDHLMPDMDGIETLSQLRKIPDCINRNTPVIALTANAMVGAKEKYGALGFSDYLSKPVKSEELELMLLQYLPGRLVTITSTEDTQDGETAQDADKDVMLNKQLGKFYCCSDDDFYKRILEMFVDNNKIRQLVDTYESKNWSVYGDILCSVKGAAMTIGAESFSTMVYSMEKCIKQGNVAYIEQNHHECITNYRKLIHEIREQLAQTNT